MVNNNTTSIGDFQQVKHIKWVVHVTKIGNRNKTQMLNFCITLNQRLGNKLESILKREIKINAFKKPIFLKQKLF